MADAPARQWQRTIGIVGGIGPHAHIALEQRLLQLVVEECPPGLNDQEYPPWIVANLPQTPDRTAALLEGEPSPTPLLLESVHKLQAAGCDFALIACNAAHAFVPELERASPLPLIDMVEETVRAAVGTHGRRATLGVLGSTGILSRGTYVEAVRRISPRLNILTPLDLGVRGEEIQEQCVMGAIFGRTRAVPIGIKSAGHHDPDHLARIRKALGRAVLLLAKNGADVVLLSCTEFPIVLEDTHEGVPLQDCLAAAARAALEVASGKRATPTSRIRGREPVQWRKNSPAEERRRESRFDTYVHESEGQSKLVVQPRMGFSSPEKMRNGLRALGSIEGRRAGTITIDSLTRCRDYARVNQALEAGQSLNGYPIVSHEPDRTRWVLAAATEADLPVQVRHGSPLPIEVFRAAATVGIDAIEGGPVSYALPYGSVPLSESIPAWTEACRFWAEDDARQVRHIESFGGCMLGQLCPPSMLLALTLLEGLFFQECGIRSLSLSYAQGTSTLQDVGALIALRRLTRENLPDVRSHLVFYTYMGVFPRSHRSAKRLIEESARVARLGGAARLITKTRAEGLGIPTIAENVEAILWAQSAAQSKPSLSDVPHVSWRWAQIIEEETREILATVVGLGDSWELAVRRAFERGVLDVPYCIHPDNLNLARPRIDRSGALRWADPGRIPLRSARRAAGSPPSSAEFLKMLAFNRRTYSEEVIAMPG